jgi:hypothetical protein
MKHFFRYHKAATLTFHGRHFQPHLPITRVDEAVWILPSIKIDQAVLFDRIDRAIRACTPDYVILHTGFVFEQNRETFERVFEKLVDAYPKIEFGIQERPGLDVFNEIFRQTGRVKQLHDLIFVRFQKPN